MFKNIYQGGPYVEIFALQDKTLLSKWILPAGGRKEFDNEAKTYVYCLQGSSSTTKIQLRKESKKGWLIHPYLVLQVNIPYYGEFSIEVGVTCYSQSRKRIYFSSVQRTLQISTLLATVPLDFQGRGKWNNLCINVVNLVSGFWKDETFQSLESLAVAGTFRLKRIFTMNDAVVRSEDPAEWQRIFLNVIPKTLQLPRFLPQVVQLISIDCLDYDPSRKSTPKPEDDYARNEEIRPKYSLLAERCTAGATESLPSCSLGADSEMKLNRAPAKSQSCSEFYSDRKGAFIAVNPTKERNQYGRFSLDQNEAHTRGDASAVRHSLSREADLCKGNLEPCTLVCKSDRSSVLSSSSGKQSPAQDFARNVCVPVYEDPGYSSGSLQLIGKKIKPVEISEEEFKKMNRPCNPVEFFAPPPVNKNKVRTKPSTSPDSRCSAPPTRSNRRQLTIKTANTKSHEVIQSGRHRKQQRYPKSNRHSANSRAQYSSSSGSSESDGSWSGDEDPDGDGFISPSQSMKLTTAEHYDEEFLDVTDINSDQAKASAIEVTAEKLNEAFENLAIHELQKHRSSTDVAENSCDTVTHGVSDDCNCVNDSRLVPFDPHSNIRVNEIDDDWKPCDAANGASDIDAEFGSLNALETESISGILSADSDYRVSDTENPLISHHENVSRNEGKEAWTGNRREFIMVQVGSVTGAPNMMDNCRNWLLENFLRDKMDRI